MVKNIKLNYNDITIVPEVVTKISSRSECNPYDDSGFLPIFASCMSSVVSMENNKTFNDSKIRVVIPRTYSYEERLKFLFNNNVNFVAFSLKETEALFSDGKINTPYVGSKFPIKICIDLANGHMKSLLRLVRDIKEAHGDKVIIMTGNIANPKAYSFYADAGVDYVRCSVGTGSRCTSSCNVSVHYPMASLLDELNEERKAYAHSHNGNAPTKLIADGGISWFDDIQKALCLGADAVMCGNLIARAEEACGPIYYVESLEDFMEGNYSTEKWSTFIHPVREYFGMSCKCAQVITGGDGSRTAEGISRPVPVEYPIAKWVDNMQSYLRSCMTYTNSHTIKEMQENAQVVILGGSGDASYRK